MEANSTEAVKRLVASGIGMAIVSSAAAGDRGQTQGLHPQTAAQMPRRGDSLEEAGDKLFTFTRFPPDPWKSIRTTNAIERLHAEGLPRK